MNEFYNKVFLPLHLGLNEEDVSYLIEFLEKNKVLDKKNFFKLSNENAKEIVASFKEKKQTTFFDNKYLYEIASINEEPAFFIYSRDDYIHPKFDNKVAPFLCFKLGNLSELESFVEQLQTSRNKYQYIFKNIGKLNGSLLDIDADYKLKKRDGSGIFRLIKSWIYKNNKEQYSLIKLQLLTNSLSELKDKLELPLFPKDIKLIKSAVNNYSRYLRKCIDKKIDVSSYDEKAHSLIREFSNILKEQGQEENILPSDVEFNDFENKFELNIENLIKFKKEEVVVEILHEQERVIIEDVNLDGLSLKDKLKAIKSYLTNFNLIKLNYANKALLKILQEDVPNDLDVINEISNIANIYKENKPITADSILSLQVMQCLNTKLISNIIDENLFKSFYKKDYNFEWRMKENLSFEKHEGFSDVKHLFKVESDEAKLKIDLFYVLAKLIYPDASLEEAKLNKNKISSLVENSLNGTPGVLEDKIRLLLESAKLQLKLKLIQCNIKEEPSLEGLVFQANKLKEDFGFVVKDGTEIVGKIANQMQIPEGIEMQDKIADEITKVGERFVTVIQQASYNLHKFDEKKFQDDFLKLIFVAPNFEKAIENQDCLNVLQKLIKKGLNVAKATNKAKMLIFFLKISTLLSSYKKLPLLDVEKEIMQGDLEDEVLEAVNIFNLLRIASDNPFYQKGNSLPQNVNTLSEILVSLCKYNNSVNVDKFSPEFKNKLQFAFNKLLKKSVEEVNDSGILEATIKKLGKESLLVGGAWQKIGNTFNYVKNENIIISYDLKYNKLHTADVKKGNITRNVVLSNAVFNENINIFDKYKLYTLDEINLNKLPVILGNAFIVTNSGDVHVVKNGIWQKKNNSLYKVKNFKLNLVCYPGLNLIENSEKIIDEIQESIDVDGFKTMSFFEVESHSDKSINFEKNDAQYEYHVEKKLLIKKVLDKNYYFINKDSDLFEEIKRKLPEVFSASYHELWQSDSDEIIVFDKYTNKQYLFKDGDIIKFDDYQVGNKLSLGKLELISDFVIDDGNSKLLYEYNINLSSDGKFNGFDIFQKNSFFEKTLLFKKGEEYKLIVEEAFPVESKLYQGVKEYCTFDVVGESLFPETELDRLNLIALYIKKGEIKKAFKQVLDLNLKGTAEELYVIKKILNLDIEYYNKNEFIALKGNLASKIANHFYLGKTFSDKMVKKDLYHISEEEQNKIALKENEIKNLCGLNVLKEVSKELDFYMLHEGNVPIDMRISNGNKLQAFIQLKSANINVSASDFARIYNSVFEKDIGVTKECFKEESFDLKKILVLPYDEVDDLPILGVNVKDKKSLYELLKKLKVVEFEESFAIDSHTNKVYILNGVQDYNKLEKDINQGLAVNVKVAKSNILNVKNDSDFYELNALMGFKGSLKFIDNGKVSVISDSQSLKKILERGPHLLDEDNMLPVSVCEWFKKALSDAEKQRVLTDEMLVKVKERCAVEVKNYFTKKSLLEEDEQVVKNKIVNAGLLYCLAEQLEGSDAVQVINFAKEECYNFGQVSCKINSLVKTSEIVKVELDEKEIDFFEEEKIIFSSNNCEELEIAVSGIKDENANEYDKKRKELFNKYCADKIDEIKNLNEKYLRDNLNKLKDFEENLIEAVNKYLEHEEKIDKEHINKFFALKGEEVKKVDVEKLLNIYFSREVNVYKSLGLKNEEAIGLDNKISEYLLLKRNIQQSSRVLNIIEKYKIDENENHLFNLGLELSTKKYPVKSNLSKKLLAFEVKNNLFLYEDKYEYAKLLFKKEVTGYDNICLEMMMSKGKTEFLLPFVCWRDSPVIIVPDELLNTTYDNLCHNLKNINIKPIKFEFSRTSDCSKSALLKQIEKIKFAFATNTPLVMTSNSIGAIYLKYIEMLYVSSPENKLIDEIKILEEILSAFKQNANVMTDEVDVVRNPKKTLISALKSEKQMNLQNRENVLSLYKFFYEKDFQGKKLSEIFFEDKDIDYIENNFVAIQEKIAEGLVNDPNSPIYKLCNSLNQANKEDLISYLLNKYEQVEQGPSFLNDLSNEERQNLFMLKKQINSILPICLTKKLNVDYGFSRNDKKVKDLGISIPYSKSDRPEEGSRHGTVLEELGFTIQSHLQTILDIKYFKILVSRFNNIKYQEMQLGALVGDDGETLADEEFFNLTGIKLKDVSIHDKKSLSEQYLSLTNDKVKYTEFVFKILSSDIIPNVKTTEKAIRFDSELMGFLTKTQSGMAGIIDEPEVLANMKLISDGKEYEKIVEKLFEKEKEGKCDFIFQEKSDDKLKTFLNKTFLNKLKDGVKYSSFLDTGALSEGYENIEIAEQIAKILKEEDKEKKFVLFFEKDELYALNIETNQKVFVGNTSQENIGNKLGCEVSEYFVIYDQVSTTGRNIKLPDNARAILYFENNTKREILQSMLRLRGYLNNQEIDFVALEHMKTPLDRKSGTYAEKLINYSEKLKNTLGFEKKFKAGIQSIDGMFLRVILKVIFEESNIENKQLILNSFSKYFEHSSIMDIDSFRAIDKKLPAVEVLKKYGDDSLIKFENKVLNLPESVKRKIIENFDKDNFDFKIKDVIGKLNIPLEYKVNSNFLVSEAVNYQANVEQQQNQQQNQKQMQMQNQQQNQNVQAKFANVMEAAYKTVPLSKNLAKIDGLTDVVELYSKNVELIDFAPDDDYKFKFEKIKISSQFLYHDYKDGYAKMQGFRRKPFNYILYKKDLDGSISATIITDETAKELKGKLNNDVLPRFWIEDVEQNIFTGQKPNSDMLREYDRCLEQILFLSGKVGRLVKRANRLVWLNLDLEEKLSYLKKNILPFGDDSEVVLCDLLCLRKDKQNLNVYSEDNKKNLIKAILNKDLAKVKIFMGKIDDLNSDIDGNNPLETALKSSSPELLSLFSKNENVIWDKAVFEMIENLSGDLLINLFKDKVKDKGDLKEIFEKAIVFGRLKFAKYLLKDYEFDLSDLLDKIVSTKDCDLINLYLDKKPEINQINAFKIAKIAIDKNKESLLKKTFGLYNSGLKVKYHLLEEPGKYYSNLIEVEQNILQYAIEQGKEEYAKQIVESTDGVNDFYSHKEIVNYEEKLNLLRLDFSFDKLFELKDYLEEQDLLISPLLIGTQGKFYRFYNGKLVEIVSSENVIGDFTYLTGTLNKIESYDDYTPQYGKFKKLFNMPGKCLVGTALHMSVLKKSEYLVKGLLNKDADYNLPNDNKETAISLLVEKFWENTKDENVFNENQEYEKIAKLFIEAESAKVSEGKDISCHLAINSAISLNNFKLVKFLVDNGININVRNANDCFLTPFMSSILKRRNKIFYYLLKQDKTDLNLKDISGKTALIHAIELGETEIAEALINKGADLSVQDNSGKTALMYSVLFNQPKIAHLLLSKGAKKGINLQDTTGKTAAMYAMSSGCPNILRVFDSVDNINYDLVDKSNQSLLIHSVVNTNITMSWDNVYYCSDENLKDKVKGTTGNIVILTKKGLFFSSNGNLIMDYGNNNKPLSYHVSENDSVLVEYKDKIGFFDKIDMSQVLKTKVEQAVKFLQLNHKCPSLFKKIVDNSDVEIEDNNGFMAIDYALNTNKEISKKLLNKHKKRDEIIFVALGVIANVLSARLLKQNKFFKNALPITGALAFGYNVLNSDNENSNKKGIAKFIEKSTLPITVAVGVSSLLNRFTSKNSRMQKYSKLLLSNVTGLGMVAAVVGSLHDMAFNNDNKKEDFLKNASLGIVGFLDSSNYDLSVKQSSLFALGASFIKGVKDRVDDSCYTPIKSKSLKDKVVGILKREKHKLAIGAGCVLSSVVQKKEAGIFWQCASFLPSAYGFYQASKKYIKAKKLSII